MTNYLYNFLSILIRFKGQCGQNLMSNVGQILGYIKHAWTYFTVTHTGQVWEIMIFQSAIISDGIKSSSLLVQNLQQ